MNSRKMLSMVCLLAVVAVCLALVVMGLLGIMKKGKGQENDVQVIQRQIRGFGYIMLAQIALIIGVTLCALVDPVMAKELIRSVSL